MLKRLFKKVSKNAAQKDMENFLAYVQSGTDSEMAMMLCATGLARQFLRTSKSITKSFPEDIIRGKIAIDQELSVELSLYVLEINKIRQQISADGNEQYQLIASGLGVFVQSIRALQHPELFVLGRSFWAELRRGEHGFSETMAAMKPNLNESELLSLMPIPNMLAPE